MSQTLEEIGAAVTQYLRRILEEGRDPDIDIPASKDIKKDLLGLLPADPSLPKEKDTDMIPAQYDPVWRGKLKVLAKTICDHFRDETGHWPFLTEILSIYFRDILVEEKTHPYIVVRKARDGQLRPNRIGNKYQILLKLAPFVIGDWIAEAPSETRKDFFRSLEGWEILHPVAEALPFWKLNTEEFSILFSKLDSITRNGMARNWLFDNIEEWAQKKQNAPILTSLVEGWMEDSAQYPGLDEFSIRVFVELLLENGFEDLEWRDHIIDTLIQENDLDLWKLATTLSCFAWPKSPVPSVTKRHQSLKKHVERLPNQLLRVALGAMARDARKYPCESLDTTFALLEMAELEKIHEPDVQERGLSLVSLSLAYIARNAIWGMKDQGYHSDKIAPLEEYSSWVPQNHVKADFDSFLRSLYECDQKLALRFLTSWLSKHAEELRIIRRSIDEHFPLLWDVMGAKEAIAWLASLLLSKDEGLRSSALSLLNVNAEGWESLPSLTWKDWGEAEAKTFVHVLMSRAVVGHFLLPTLFTLGKEREDVLPLLTGVIENELMLEYPEQCKQYLYTHWRQEATDETPTLLQEASEHLLGKFEELTSTQNLKEDFVELHAIHPFHEAMFEQFNEQLAASYRQVSQRPDRLFHLLPKIPIARGEGTFAEKGQVGEQKFTEFSSQVDIPLLELCDPMGREMLRTWHKEQVENLLAKKEGTT